MKTFELPDISAQIPALETHFLGSNMFLFRDVICLWEGKPVKSGYKSLAFSDEYFSPNNET